jgi:hypothetical protein
MSRHEAEVADLRRSVLESSGVTDPVLRQAAFTGHEVPAPWTRYVEKVRDQSYRLTDADVRALIDNGCTEDAIFEVTIAAALGAAAARLEAGLRGIAPGG